MIVHLTCPHSIVTYSAVYFYGALAMRWHRDATNIREAPDEVRQDKARLPILWIPHHMGSILPSTVWQGIGKHLPPPLMPLLMTVITTSTRRK